MRFTSSDGLMSSSDPGAVQRWEAIGARMASDEKDWTARLREMGVKMAHPDDGWVHEPGRGYTPDNPAKWLSPTYAQFDDGPKVGDVIALGWPWKGYRMVRVTEVRRRRGVLLLDRVDYYYEDTGRLAHA